MKINYSPTFRISVALVTITICAVISAYFFGLIPDESKAELDARAKIAETLTVQLASAAGRDDVEAIQETIDSLQLRNSDVLSVAMRKADGKVLIASDNHSIDWVDPGEVGSTPTHVKVPLHNGDKLWGQVEIAFKPLLIDKTYFGIPTSVVNFTVFLGAVGFLGYFFLLGRALKELDPSKVVPKRVHAAFDTLEEGVVILDENENILLANASFCEIIGQKNETLFGKKIESLSWRQWSEESKIKEFPWRVAINERNSIKAVSMGLRIASNDARSFLVNASCITDDKKNVSGAIVTFSDVTPLERKNEDLIQAVQKLKSTELEINRQNRELSYLASHDPLTGCLNRRAFFSKLEEVYEKTSSQGQHLCAIMVDLDHFKSVNDRFGHSVGDDVIKGVAQVLGSTSREDVLVGRYGGEEFCISVSGVDSVECKEFAESIRQKISQASSSWFPVKEIATASIGIAMFPHEKCSVMDIVDLADKALYHAKESGRNRSVLWQDIENSGGVLNLVERDLEQTPDNSNPAMDQATAGTSQQIAAFGTMEAEEQKLFIDRLSHSISRADRSGNVAAALLVSINSAEIVSEMFGETAAEMVQKSIVDKLEDTLRRTDTVALLENGNSKPSLSKLPKDKIAIEISDVANADVVLWIVKRVFEALLEPIMLDDEAIYLNCSMGVSVYPNDGNDAETLIRNASVAERNARQGSEKNSYLFFSDEMNANTRNQMEVEAGIRHALEHNEFLLYYQPIVDVNTLEVAGVEALLRSSSSKLVDKSVEYIVSVAEQIGLMPELGMWIMKNAISQIGAWHAEGIPIPKVSVNVSAAQFYKDDNVEEILDVITNMAIKPQHLQIEITETSELRDIEAAGLALKRFQQLGVQIALDDFGAGQCSLTYLQKFRPDILKIDRSFVEHLGSSNADESVVAVCSALSNRMGMRLVAEGVETETQLERIRDLECHEAQGYLFGRPIPSKEMTEWLRMFATSEQSSNDVPVAMSKSA